MSKKPKVKENKPSLLRWTFTFGIGGFGKVYKGDLVTSQAREALESMNKKISDYAK